MNRSCKYCGRYHDVKFECPSKPVRTKKLTEAARFRGRSVWKRKSIEIRKRDKGLCQYCKPQGQYRFDVEVHHIIKLEQDIRLGLVNTNLISLCKACHVLADSGKIEVKILKDFANRQEQENPNPY